MVATIGNVMIQKVFFLPSGWLLASLIAGATGIGCGDNEPSGDTSRSSVEERVHGLTKAQAAEPLVQIGDETITVGEFAERLAEQSPYVRARFEDFERRREFLDNMLKHELLAAEAKRRGYYQLPDVVRARNRAMIQQLVKTEIEDRITIESITDDEIRAYYDAHQEEYNTPAQVRASHILIRDRQAAQRVLQQVLAAPDDMELFHRLADEHNEDPHTRERRGDLQFFSQPGEPGDNAERVPAAVARAAFSIEEVGGVYPELVATDSGFHILKLRARRVARHQTLDEVSRPIRHELWRQRRTDAEEALIQRIRDRTEVETHWNLLEQVHIDAPEGASPTVEPPASDSHQH